MTRVRDSSGEMTSKEGFSVVAPISVMSAALHVGQEGVLLGLVEAVDLVDKEDRSPARPLELHPGLLDDAPDLLDTGENRRKGDEVGLRLAGDDAGKRGLPGAGRPPEDHGKEAVLLDGLAQQPPFSRMWD